MNFVDGCMLLNSSNVVQYLFYAGHILYHPHIYCMLLFLVFLKLDIYLYSVYCINIPDSIADIGAPMANPSVCS
jgi:hypothetical protein